MQTTCDILMIRPVNFGFNPETAVNNAFQSKSDDKDAQEKAGAEFDHFILLLREKGLRIHVINDTPDPHTPDSIFPNNWISFHESNKVCLYPMFAPNRRHERKPDVLEMIRTKFKVAEVIDLTVYEKDGRFLEGTGSMVLDRDQKIAYACLSPRTDRSIFLQFCDRMGYQPVFFTALDEQDQLIYHTNVLMCVGSEFVVICLEAIKDPGEREKISSIIHHSGKALLPISYQQLNHFAGNMLQVKIPGNDNLLVMSTQAYQSLDPFQLKILEGFNPILHAPLETIERNGGGSARCMMAEIFLEPL